MQTQIVPQFPLPTLFQVGNQLGSGLILCKRHHSELVGWGAAIGGLVDCDVRRVIPIGQVSWEPPQTHLARQKAYAIRRQWFSLTQKIASHPVSLQRAVSILRCLQRFFGTKVIIELPDEVIAELVGVCPSTVAIARQAVQSIYHHPTHENPPEFQHQKRQGEFIVIPPSNQLN